MPEYRLYCIDGVGKISSAPELIEARSDGEAIVFARAKRLVVRCEDRALRVSMIRVLGRASRGVRRTVSPGVKLRGLSLLAARCPFAFSDLRRCEYLPRPRQPSVSVQPECVDR